MHMGMKSNHTGVPVSRRYFFTATLVIVFVILSGSQSANALPAFARKYGLRCSACHETWPMLKWPRSAGNDPARCSRNGRGPPPAG